MALLFLDETLKKPQHGANTKRLDTSVAATNYSNIINDSVETDSNSLISDLEKGGECQPLLGLHGHRKTLVFHSVLYCLTYNYCQYCCDHRKSDRLKQLLKKAQYKLIIVINLMKDRKVFLSTTLYGSLGFAVIIFNEVHIIRDNMISF